MSVIVLVVMVVVSLVVLQASVKFRVSGKVLCGILGKDRGVTFKLLKEGDGGFVKDSDDQWMVSPGQARLVWYPMAWGGPMRAFQQLVPCQLVLRGRMEPLDWENPSSGVISSKELGAILDPHWMVNLVKGIGEDSSSGRLEKLLPFLAIGIGAASLLLTFVVLSRLGALEQLVKLVR